MSSPGLKSATMGIQLPGMGQGIARAKDHWFWRAVLFPVVFTRPAQTLVIYFSRIFPEFAGSNPPVWDFQLKHLLSAWASWDSGWYLSIIKEGYALSGPVSQVQSNIAFYPLYPYLVKIVSWPVYSLIPKDMVLIGFGVLLANCFLLGAMYLLYKLITLVFSDVELAERSILYMLVFPTAFYFSCFYTESTFLFFAVASFYFAKTNKWLLASLMAALASLSRPLGVTIVVPLVFMYLEAAGWNFRKLRPDFLLLGLAPAALLLYMIGLYPVTADFLAIFNNTSGLGKGLCQPDRCDFLPALARV
ncbi:MAG TPA: mannosyltransferase family protein [Anaerovoracaceae bacterium]|nr:mannosyltransferase family protein [Anaerovoracaceae bacterium]